MSGAPVVFAMIADEAERLARPLDQPISGMLAGAAPSPTIIERTEAIGITITHVYGLTEVYGPAAVCAAQDDWVALTPAGRAGRKARQGVASLMQETMEVLDPVTLLPVPQDGETVGEIMFRGNTTMSGYWKNPEATEACFTGGRFRTGDLAVIESDGYVRITDRSKDVIISGGENVSSIEVEEVLQLHMAVAAAAVVACPDERWGEVPCAFVELKTGGTTTAEELRRFCRTLLPGFKTPKVIVFGPIPRSSTGKVQKFVLRELARASIETPSGAETEDSHI